MTAQNAWKSIQAEEKMQKHINVEVMRKRGCS
jgi:hypothetical protein